MTRRNMQYGWLPDLPDQRDLPYMATRPLQLSPIELPSKIDMRNTCPPVYNQGSLGSCTAQAIIAAYEMELIKNPDCPDVSLSKLFLYYNERAMLGTIQVDSGAYIRDGVKSIKELGVCLDTCWPYNIKDFRVEPTPNCYEQALEHQAVIYASISRNIQDVMTALADGYPVIFGFTVYESFESAEVAASGIVDMPKSTERVLGGHAVLAVGYDQETRMLLVRNSWGESWGQQGYFWMPFEYIRLASDFWVLKQVE